MTTQQQEINKIYNDFFNNITPKRLPVGVSIYSYILAQLTNSDPKIVQFDYKRVKEAAAQLCESFYSDTCPISGGSLSTQALFNAYLNSQCFKMSDKGFIQHPEVVGMHDNEYDEYFADPYAFILEKVIPRQYQTLADKSPEMRANIIKVATDIRAEDSEVWKSITGPLTEKYGYYSGAPKGSSNSNVRAPLDFVADFLRSFSGISKDIRRNPEKVKAAADAIYPFMFNLGNVPNPHPEGQARIPLHMPTFMRDKDFENIYLPSFLRMIREFAALGIRCNLFCEHDWTRYLDILQDFPAGALLRFEYGDAKLYKDKLGSKFFIGGFFPTELLSTTKEACIDKVKEVLDIMMPGCGYLFGFDKSPLVLSDINFECLNAVTTYIRDNAVYDNPGTPFGQKLNSEGYTCDVEKSSYYESKYKFSWEEFKANNPYAPDIAKPRIEEKENELMKLYFSILG